MAEVRRTFTSLHSHGDLLFICYLDYDDADYQEINDDGDPDDFRMIRFEATNYHDRPLLVTMQRGNGTNWVSREIAPGQTVTQAAGGAIKYESDIPRYFFEWVQ